MLPRNGRHRQRHTVQRCAPSVICLSSDARCVARRATSSKRASWRNWEWPTRAHACLALGRRARGLRGKAALAKRHSAERANTRARRGEAHTVAVQRRHYKSTAAAAAARKEWRCVARANTQSMPREEERENDVTQNTRAATPHATPGSSRANGASEQASGQASGRANE